MLDKRGKVLVIAVVLAAAFLVVFLSSSLAVSSMKSKYLIGENVQISFPDKVAYSLKVSSPQGEFIKKGEAMEIDYLPPVIGKYSFTISYLGKTEQYSFQVVETTFISEVRSSVINGSSDLVSNTTSLNFSTSYVNNRKIMKAERTISRNEKEVFFNSSGSLNNFQQNITLQQNISMDSVSRINVQDMETGEPINFTPIDSNQDGFADIIQIQMSQVLSYQTYEIIILISGAEHLDINRNFVENIYDSVQARDQVWSSSILDQEYVRVNFEKNLSSMNDITLYPRIISGNPTIEVYEINQTNKIAEFTNIKNDSLNKIYLTSLQNQQDTFDLKIVGGVLQFDFITDPFANTSSTIYRCGDINASGSYTLNQSITSGTSCLNVSASNVLINCAGNTITYNSGGGNGFYGINASKSANLFTNLTVKNCIIRKSSAAGTTSYGVYLAGYNNSLILNNNITTNGTSDNYGVYVFSNSFFNNISGNRITAQGSTTNNIGVYLGLRTSNTYVGNNIILTNGTNTNYGVYAVSNATVNSTGNVITMNNITTNRCIGTNCHGVFLTVNQNNNNITYNNISVLSTTPVYGIELLGSAAGSVNNNYIAYNNITSRATTSQGMGIYISSNASYNNIFYNNITTSGITTNYGIELIGTNPLINSYNTVYGNTINTTGTGTNNYGVYAVTNSNWHNITSNIIGTSGTSGNDGVVVSGLTYRSQNNTVSLNKIYTGVGGSITTTGNFGIYLLTNTSFNNVTSNFVDTNGTTTSHGIFLTGAAGTIVNNNSILYNNITTYGANAASNSIGILLQNNPNYNNISYNNVLTSGTSTNYGIYLFGTNAIQVEYNVVDNNNVSTTGSGGPNHGIYVSTNASYNSVTHNIVLANGSSGNYGVYLLGAANANTENNSIDSNNITAAGSAVANSNIGLFVSSNSNWNNFTNNNITAFGTTNSQGVELVGAATLTCNSNLVSGNTIRVNGSAAASVTNYGVYMTLNVNSNNITYNDIHTIGNTTGYGFYLLGAANAHVNSNLLSNNNITTWGNGSSNHGIYLFTNVSYNDIYWNNIIANGSTTNYGIYLNGPAATTSATYNDISQNTIQSVGRKTGPATGYGVYLQNLANNNNITFNTINVTGTTANIGVYSLGTATLTQNSNLISSNIIGAIGTGTNNCGINVTANANLNDIINNTIYVNGTTGNTGIYLSGALLASNSNEISFNGITTAGQNTNPGIWLTTNTGWNNLTGNTIVTGGSLNDYGIYFSANASNNTLTSNDVSTNSGYGIYLLASNNTIINSSTFTNTNNASFYSSGSNNTLAVSSTFSSIGAGNYTFFNGPSINNTFLNCTYDVGREYVSAGSKLTVLDYYTAILTGTTGQKITGVSVSVKDVDNISRTNLTTDSNGISNTTTIIDYINNGTLIDYYSNYTINVSKGGAYLIHTYNATSGNGTDEISMDLIAPEIEFVASTEDSGVFRNRNWIYVNVTNNETNLENITYVLYNKTSSVNTTNYLTNITSINWTSLPNGIYFYNVTSCDTSENCNNTETRNITLDTIYPQIQFALTQDANEANVSRTWLFFNVSLTEINLVNVTYVLSNYSGILNTTTYTSNSSNTINWTGLENGRYTYNATSCDFANNCNNSGNRNITLDNTNPNSSLVSPANLSNITNTLVNFTANISDNIGIKNATVNVFNASNSTQLINRTTVSYASGTLTTTVGIVVSLVDGIYTWFYNLFDWAGNSYTTGNNTLTLDSTPPTISVQAPDGGVDNYGETIPFGIQVNDLHNISVVSATVTLPDNYKQNVSMRPNPASGNSYFVENTSVSSNQFCSASNGFDIGFGVYSNITLSGDGSPNSDTLCSFIANKPLFGDFDVMVNYNITSLELDSAINLQISSEKPTSANATIYGYIGRTNFAGEGNQYQAFGEDNFVSGFLNKTDTTDSYGRMRIKRAGNLFSFYFLNNSNGVWILLGSQTYDMSPGVFMILESESISDNYGSASAIWSNFTFSDLASDVYVGTFSNTSLQGTYNVQFFANDTFGNINNYTYGSFKINDTNYAPSTPFIIAPTINSQNSQYLNITWSGVSDVNGDNLAFNISLLNSDGTFNETIISNYSDSNSDSYLWDTTTVPDGKYGLKVEVKETSTLEKYSRVDTLAGNFTIDNTPPVCSLISRSPGDIMENSTGLFNVLINCTDANGINVQQFEGGHYRNFVTRTADAFVVAPGVPNYWSVRYPDNSLGVAGTLTPPFNIWRAEGRNRGYWFENLTGFSDCAGQYPCYQPLNDIFSYAIEDGHYGQLVVTNTSSTSALLNYTYIVEVAAFRQMVYLSWDSMIAEEKKNYSIKNNNYLLMKRFDAEAYRGIQNYTHMSFRNMDGKNSPADVLKAYYCNSSYNPAGSTKVVDSPNCGFISSLSEANLNNKVLSEKNSSYSKGTYAVTNGFFGGIKATAEFYIEYETLENSGSYELKYANGSTITGMGFNETNVAWTTNNGGTSWTQAPWTPDVFSESVRATNDEFQFGVYAEDVAGNSYANFNLFSDPIILTNHPISYPSVLEYNSTQTINDLGLNGIHRGIMNIKVGIASDADGVGIVTHNLSLYNVDGTFNHTINGSFKSSDDSAMWINFDTRNVSDGTYKMKVLATADDNPADVKNRTTSQNFTIFNKVTSLSFDKVSPQNYSTLVNASCVYLNNTNFSGTLELIRDGINVTSSENNQLIFLSYGVHNYSCQYITSDNYTYSENKSFNIMDNLNPFANQTSLENITVNFSDVGSGLNNATFYIFNLSGLVNQTTIFFSGVFSAVVGIPLALADGIYTWFVTVFDIEGNQYTTLNETFTIDTIEPAVQLIYPNQMNFSSTWVPQFNFSVVDSSAIANCSLYGNWSGGWHANQTILNPANNTELNFSGVNVSVDGYYSWNVECIDVFGNSAFNSTNYVIAAFYPAVGLNSSTLNSTQSVNDGSGDVTLSWVASPNADKYIIYSSNSINGTFSYLNETKDVSFTDVNAYQDRRVFYKISAWNPTSENISSTIIGKTVYVLQQKANVNTRNWINLYLNNSESSNDANSIFSVVPDITSIVAWNETIQKRVECNKYLCPSYPECTDTNCNFNFSKGKGYEVYISSSSPTQVNWSMVGIVDDAKNISLNKNSTGFGKNWAGIPVNSLLTNAQKLVSNVSHADAVTNWDSINQKSVGYIRTYSFPPYLGTNFALEPEKGYEISVNQSTNWMQV